MAVFVALLAACAMAASTRTRSAAVEAAAEGEEVDGATVADAGGGLQHAQFTAAATRYSRHTRPGWSGILGREDRPEGRGRQRSPATPVLELA